MYTLFIAFLALALGACSKQSTETLIAAAHRHIAEGNHRAAHIELRNAAQQAPSNGEVYRLLGNVQLRLGDPEGAEIALRKARTLGEKEDDVAPGLAQALLQQGQPKKVVDEFGSVNLQEPAAGAALKARVGEAWLMRGEVKPAAEAFANALTLQPGQASALLGQARIAAQEGRLDDALATTDRALQADARLVGAHAFRGQLLMAKGQRQQAMESLEKALALDGDYLLARLTLASILIDAKDLEKAKTILGAAGPAAKDPRLLFLRGLVAFLQGDLPKAKDTVAGVLVAAPEYLAALILAGEIELRSNNPAIAEAYLSKAMRVQPTPAAQRLLAATYLRQNRPGKAIETLQPLLQEAGPKSAGLTMLAGEAYLANGDYRLAAEYFEASKTAGANETAVRTRLGQLAVNEGHFERGVQELQAASAASAQSVEPDLLLVSVHLRRQEPAKALAAANAFIKKQPQNPLGYVLAGTAQALDRDLQGARRSFEAALKIKPDHVPALRGLADLDVAEGKADEAQRRYDALLAKKPDDDQILVAAATLQERTGRLEEAAKSLQKAIAANPKAREPVVALVRLHLRRKDPNAALLVAQEAVTRNPDEMNLVMLLGMTQESAGANREALRTLTSLVLKEPHAAAPLIRLAQLQTRQRDFEGAARTLQRAQEKAPKNELVMRDLVGVYVQSGKIDQALKVAKDLQTSRPDFAGGHVLEGDIRAHTKKWPDAERAYRAALKTDPNAGAAAVKVYGALLAGGKKKQADEFAAEWMAQHPSDLPMRMLAADTALRAGDLPVAIKLYEQALALSPNQPLVLNNLAWALGQNKDPRALALAERAAALAPNSADVLDTLGVLHLQLGDPKKGLEVLDRVRQLQPDRPDLRLHYAKGLLQNGRTQEGKAELRELAAAKADFPGKAEIPALLAKP
ncbi:MAG TPA: XrtA/PEP-CTERM system TPR-repeat protein PrsT [Burkholderiaceae bacterium]